MADKSDSTISKDSEYVIHVATEPEHWNGASPISGTLNLENAFVRSGDSLSFRLDAASPDFYAYFTPDGPMGSTVEISLGDVSPADTMVSPDSWMSWIAGPMPGIQPKVILEAESGGRVLTDRSTVGAGDEITFRLHVNPEEKMGDVNGTITLNGLEFVAARYGDGAYLLLGPHAGVPEQWITCRVKEDVSHVSVEISDIDYGWEDRYGTMPDVWWGAGWAHQITATA